MANYQSFSTLKKNKKRGGGFSVVSAALLALAIVFSSGTIAYVTFASSPGLKGHVEDEIIYGLSDENVQKAVSEAFLSSITQYINGDITYDEMKEILCNLIEAYAEATDGFTGDQRSELTVIIGDYISSTTIYTDIEQNTKNIEKITNLFQDYVTENDIKITKIEEEITKNYNELKANIEELNTSIETTNETVATLDKDVHDLIYGTEGVKAYSSKTVYTAGDYCIYSNKLYQALEQTSDKPKDSKAWREMSLTALIDELNENLAKQGDTTESYIGLTTWDNTTTYTKNSYVVYNNTIYYSLIDDNMDEPGLSENWIAGNLLTFISDLRDDMQKKISDLDVKTATNLDDAKKQLNKIIDDNANLSEEERAKLKKDINDLDELTAENLKNLDESLNKTIDESNTLSAAERAKLKENISQVSDSLAKALAELEKKVDNNDTKINNRVDVTDSNVEIINGQLSDGSKTFYFGYDTKSGAYGYYIENADGSKAFRSF